MSASIETITRGAWVPAGRAQPWPCPVRAIVLGESLAERAEALLRSSGLAGRLAVVADPNTWEALGRAVTAALPGAEPIVLRDPHADVATATTLLERTRHADALVAVGSGTLNDLVKHASHRRGTAYAVFATAPSMNGYVTATASLARGGLKLSLPAASPVGAFFDLGVLAGVPRRLVRAGLGDALSRTTAQADWLLAHRLLGTAYDPAPFALQAADEAIALARAEQLPAGDREAVAALTRLLILGGLGMLLAGSSAPASQGEHLISHYVDTLAEPHPGTLHGEQVAVATWTMARLQRVILERDAPPRLRPVPIDAAALVRRFGELAPDCRTALAAKPLDEASVRHLQARLDARWPALVGELRAVMLPLDRLEAAMRAAGLPMRAADLGLDPAFWREAVRHARALRDRFTVLDLAAAAGILDAFAAGEG